MKDRFGPRAPNHIMLDLQRKTGDDVGARIRQTAQLVRHPTDMMMLAISGASVSLGTAAGFIAHIHPDLTAEQQLDLIWQILRPISLAALGGSRAELDELLRHCRPGDAI